MEYIQAFIYDLFAILNEMSPFLLLGLFFAGLLNVFLPERFITKFLRKNNTKSAVNAAILGIPLPLCSCGVLPTGVSLYKNGASKGATNAFLTSTPQTGIDSILVTYGMLGLPMAIIRPIVALISGIISGIITNKVVKNENVHKQKEDTQPSTCVACKPSLAKRWQEVFKYAFITFLADIAKWLIIGVIAAAIISVILPDDFFATYMSKGILGIIIILLASMPLYICATASVPIAAVLMSKGISPGAILVFLMAGPATNAASFTLIGKTLGKRSLFAYLFTIIISAIAFGVLVDAFLPIEWFHIDSLSNLNGKETYGVHCWFRSLSTAILLTLILYIYIDKYRAKYKNLILEKEEKLFAVPDVSCNHCKTNLEAAFNQENSVEYCNVNVSKRTLLIKGNITDKEIEQIIIERGFSYEGRLYLKPE